MKKEELNIRGYNIYVKNIYLVDIHILYIFYPF